VDTLRACGLRRRGFSARAWLYGCCVLRCGGIDEVLSAVAGGLLISRRQYKQAGAAVVVCGFSTLIGLWMLCPDLAASWHGTQFWGWRVFASRSAGV